MNIYDIARKSGVSIATVSRVLNGGKNVSAATKARVLAVISEEGYTPNAFARGLGLNSMKMVGILCTDLRDAFYAKAVSLTVARLRERGFSTFLECTGDDPAAKKSHLQNLLDKRVDGILLIGSVFRENRDNSHILSAAESTTVVIINGYLEGDGVYCVLCDEKGAMAGNVSQLYQAGAQRILCLHDQPTYSCTQKLEGYRRGLADCGLPEDAGLILRVEKSLDDAREKVLALLASGVAFDAVVATEDLLAVGAQKALSAAGKEVPIIGFNNSVIAQVASPALTSVDNMLDTLCPAAVDLLAGVLEGTPAPQKTVVSARLVQRDTFPR